MKHILAIGALLLLSSPALADDAPRFTDWGPPENLGSVINSPYLDSCVSISKNGLTLIFSSNRHTGNPASQDRDLYVSKRASVDDPWGEPEPLTMLNRNAWDSCPALSLDEHRLYFTSARPGGCGVGHDFWVSHRRNRKDDLGWEEPVNLGCESDGFVNSAASDLFPTFFEDETGRVFMYFGSNRDHPDNPSNYDLYQSEMRGDDSFGPATPLVGLNSTAMEHSVTVRRDGLEVIFGSNRTGVMRFWTATRASTSDPWSTPFLVSSLPAGGGGRFAMSFDGRELYFSGVLPGTYGSNDLWVARREKLR